MPVQRQGRGKQVSPEPHLRAWGTSVPKGFEVRGLGPIGVSTWFFKTVDGYAAGNVTGVTFTSATNWSFGANS